MTSNPRVRERRNPARRLTCARKSASTSGSGRGNTAATSRPNAAPQRSGSLSATIPPPLKYVASWVASPAWGAWSASVRMVLSIIESGAPRSLPSLELRYAADLASGVTGEVHHVDCGYHIVGMKNPAAPDIAIVESGGDTSLAKEPTKKDSRNRSSRHRRRR